MVLGAAVDPSFKLFLDLAEWSEGVPRAKFTALRKILANNGVNLPSLRCRESRLKKITNIPALYIDCCINSCVAFTSGYATLDRCPVCNEPRRHVLSQAPRKQYVYIPVSHRLRLQYSDPSQARLLKAYRKDLFRGSQRLFTQQGRVFRDFFDGDLFQNFHRQELGLFDDPRDIAFQLSLDGVQLTNLRHHEVIPVILCNINLPPEERYQAKNILPSMVIPGPKKPRQIDSFLFPLVQELLHLNEGIDAMDADSAEVSIIYSCCNLLTFSRHLNCGHGSLL